MCLLIIYLPFITGITLGLFGRCIGYKGGSIISSINIIITFIISLVIFYEVGLNISPIYIDIGTYINIDTFNIRWEILIDNISSIMYIIIATISMCVYIYSTSYMKEDPHLLRFLSYLNLFTFFMLVLVSSNNLIITFIGWEGIGIVSYLLIGFWFTRLSTSNSSMKAIILNRVGDWGLSIGIISIYELIGSLNYNVINNTTFLFNTISPLIIIFLFIGAIGKSAQLGLHTWLYSAMEGPTPVSSLLHAATLVTAGIFLNIKISSLLELNTTCLYIITIIGTLTTLYGASMALVSYDIKRIIALSTMSQLGLMIISIGLSNYNISLYHLFNHSFVKALLFLSAGAIIHNIYNEQDIRNMGGLIKYLPLPYLTILIASLSLGGFPFLSCFYSKDIIIESTYITPHYNIWNGWGFPLSYFFTSFSSLLTIIYSFKIIISSFIYKPKWSYNLLPSLNISYNILIPLIILSIPTIFIGYITKDYFTYTFFSYSIYTNNNKINIIEYIPIYIKIIPILFSIGGIGLALIIYLSGKGIKTRNTLLDNYVINKGYIDYIYHNIISYNILLLSHQHLYKEIDRGLLEYIGPTGVTNYLIYISRFFSYVHSGYIYHYLLIFTFFTFFLINDYLFFLF